jgi:glycerol kinase
MASFILAIDQGTTSSRAIIFDARSKPVAIAQQEFKQHFPKPGWVEHDPEDLWKTVISTSRSAMRKARIRPNELAGIGITNQRDTTIIWDRKTGKAIHRAFVWHDRRTA